MLGLAPIAVDLEEEGIATERSVGFLVTDLDGAFRELHAAGAEAGGIAENGRWRYAHFRAPDGKVSELIEERVSAWRRGSTRSYTEAG